MLIIITIIIITINTDDITILFRFILQKEHNDKLNNMILEYKPIAGDHYYHHYDIDYDDSLHHHDHQFAHLHHYHYNNNNTHQYHHQ